MITKNVKLASGVALLAILMAVGMAQGAATLNVCECKVCGCHYLSIQEAIEKASPGDVILVRSGTFHGNINVSKSITLRGERWHGGDLPLINADGNGSAITVSANEARVEFVRATNSGNESGDAGIRVVSNNGTIRGNFANDNGGSGIILEGARNCTVEANLATNNIRGISLTNSEGNVIFNNRLYNNTELDAFDDGINRWDDGSSGNYYGTFNCTNEDNDTICDFACNISGGSSVDALPLVS
ncbi:MAG TPA: NosD domain-containing protein [Methanothrix sp.]|nr:NosD domain-containing protein [Methanothrix sp.]HPR66888.1 NosD domain-containing protein [Methanothrix sp.]